MDPQDYAKRLKENPILMKKIDVFSDDTGEIHVCHQKENNKKN